MSNSNQLPIRLNFSSCPNDTFMFDAMIHHKIDTEGLTFDVGIADVEALNHEAMEEDIAVTKLSYHAYAHVAERYKILSSGSALGRGNGPLLVCKHHIDDMSQVTVAIPGKYTTAAVLLRLAFPKITKTELYLFSDIEPAVMHEEVAAGVLIHEGRFTYAHKGLQLIADLGKCYEERTSQSIPLGCIAVSRTLEKKMQETINRVLRRSIEFALANPRESLDFISEYAQEMDYKVMQQHIALYVNNFSVDLGTEGRKSVETFFAEVVKEGVIDSMPRDIFLDE